MNKKYIFRALKINLICIILIFAVSDSYAQEHSVETGESTEIPELSVKSNLQFGIRAIYAPKTFTFIGKIQQSSFLGLGFQAWHTNLRFGDFRLRLGSELMAASRIKFPENGLDGPKERRYGLGFIPVIAQVPLVEGLFFSGSGGTIIFPGKFPDNFGTTVNFLFDFGLGYDFPIGLNGNKFQIGYNVHHISNAGTGRINPGIDFHMFYIGFRF